MKKFGKLWKVIAVVALLAAVAATTTNRVGAEDNKLRAVVLFGSVGITRGQTARLNVFVPGDPVLPGATPGDPVRPIVVTLFFVDENGHVVTSYPGCTFECSESSTKSINPGHSASFEINGDSAIPPSMTRLQLQGQVWTSGDGAKRGLLATTELIDNVTHMTTLLYHPGDPVKP